MRIAGLQNLSLVDYPGHLSAAVFLHGCNFKCGYCQNPDLLEPVEELDFSEKEVLDFISMRKEFVEGVVITGGEPTVHPDLFELLKKIKELGVLVKLDTNGSNSLSVEGYLRERLLDYIAIDIKTSPEKYHLLTNVENIEEELLKTVRLTMLSTLPYEFRTTCVPGIVNEADFRLIGEMVKGAKRYCLQQFRPMITYDKRFEKVKPYKPGELKKFKEILENYVEAVDIRGL